MAKITQEQRTIYQQSIKIYKNKIDEIRKEINSLKIVMLKDKNKEPKIRFKMANLFLNLVTNYCALNEISVYLLDVKNMAFLEKARQELYESIMNIEKIVTNYVDVPFNEYSDRLIPIAEITDLERLYFIRKLGYCIDLIKENYGENTKWKWSFVEVDARYSIVTKNIFDLKRYQALDDPREAGYTERKQHMSIMQKLLFEASHGYRDKFEFSTKDVEDLKKATDLHKALLRINQIIGDDVKIEKCKKQIDFWTNIIEKHLEKIEEEKKKKQLAK